MSHRVACRQHEYHYAPLGAREVLAVPFAAQYQRTATRLIGLLDLLGRRDHLAATREVGPGQELEDVLDLRPRMLDDIRRRGRHFLQVVRRDAGGEADGDAK